MFSSCLMFSNVPVNNVPKRSHVFPCSSVPVFKLSNALIMSPIFHKSPHVPVNNALIMPSSSHTSPYHQSPSASIFSYISISTYHSVLNLPTSPHLQFFKLSPCPPTSHTSHVFHTSPRPTRSPHVSHVSHVPHVLHVSVIPSD